ncbi:MAG: hypothetical protein Q4G51_13815 [Dermatophilus congolensis]|nr:hypothetical protein [Dermatophilus congolensis]
MNASTAEATRSAAKVDQRRAALPVRLWILAAVLVILGAVAGAGAGAALLGDKVVAESRLVVGDQTIRAQSVPGYSLATQQLAVTYSRLIGSDAVGAEVPEGVAVDASPIPDSAIVRVRAEATDEGAAIAAADAAAQALVAAADEARARNTSDSIAEGYLEARADLDRARATQTRAETPANAYQVELAQTRVDALQQAYRERVVATANNATALAVTQKGEIVSSSLPRAGALGGLVGAAAVAFVLGLVFLVRLRRD